MDIGNYNIIAVDFDGTLCHDCYPSIGAPNLRLIYILRELRKKGTRLILWTCRCGEPLKDALRWSSYHGLEFDAVNENLPEILEKYGSDSRKIFADIYIDDRSFPDIPGISPSEKSVFCSPEEYEDIEDIAV
jgi:hydroxymethylpyrimidine pyrophosphatase-like HAD family hydrolase